MLDIDGEAAARVAKSVGGESVQADLGDSAVLDALDLAFDILVNNTGFHWSVWFMSFV